MRSSAIHRSGHPQSADPAPPPRRQAGYVIDRLLLLLGLLAAFLLGLPLLSGSGATPITQIDPTQVNAIRVFGQGQLRLDLLRDPDGWLLTHPEITRARAARVQQLLALLQAPSLQRWSVSSALLASSGLENPDQRLEFDQQAIFFGGPSVPPGRRYLRAGDHIHLVDEIWFQIASLPASHFQEAP